MVILLLINLAESRVQIRCFKYVVLKSGYLLKSLICCCDFKDKSHCSINNLQTKNVFTLSPIEIEGPVTRLKKLFEQFAFVSILFNVLRRFDEAVSLRNCYLLTNSLQTS